MGSDFYTDAFAADVARVRDPAWAEPDSKDTATVRARLDALADELADQLSTRVRDLPAAAPEGAHLVVRDAGDWQLARLRALREIRTVAERLADRTVAAAGIRGAGYPQLGDAWAITRQGARKKWPDAVSAMSPPPAGQEPRTTLDAFGGSVELSWHGAEGGWWWIGEGADGATAESAITHDTKEQAAADAGAFLQQHTRLASNGDPQ
ncbi:hypothetical protein ACFWHG_33785 [Streptomyces microflavus]|uniref:hypothetical protein n=1 Tax=Streptomyces microflavus TaxID=1919 RepID=UPI00364F4A4C